MQPAEDLEQFDGAGVCDGVYTHCTRRNTTPDVEQSMSWVTIRSSLRVCTQVESEQTNSALALGVALGRDCQVKAAGGFLVQVHGPLKA